MRLKQTEANANTMQCLQRLQNNKLNDAKLLKRK